MMYKQECIPVGCVPAAAVAASRCQNQGGEGLGRPLLEVDPHLQTPLETDPYQLWTE